MIRRKQPPVSAEAEAERPRGFDDFDLRLGDVMRGERATMGKSLLDVQRELKIRATYISAIEHADPTAFETPGFVAGYVRSYARYLGLDPEWAYAKFCEEGNFATVHGMDAAASSPKTTRASSAPARKSSDPLADPEAMFVPRAEAIWSRIEPGAIGSLMVLCLLIGGLGFGGWTVLQEIQRVEVTPGAAAPGVVAELAPAPGNNALETLNADGSTGGTAAEQALARLYRPQPLDLPVLVARDGPISTLAPGSTGAMVDSLPRLPSQLAGLSADTPPGLPGAPAAPAVQVVEESFPEVAVAALRPAWVRITGADGTVLFEKILEAGESFDLPQTEDPASLRAGNSGSVYFIVNGQAYGPAAPGAQVVKNVALAPETLKTAFAEVDPSEAEVATMVAALRARWQEPETAPAE